MLILNASLKYNFQVGLSFTAVYVRRYHVVESQCTYLEAPLSSSQFTPDSDCRVFSYCFSLSSCLFSDWFLSCPVKL